MEDLLIFGAIKMFYHPGSIPNNNRSTDIGHGLHSSLKSMTSMSTEVTGWLLAAKCWPVLLKILGSIASWGTICAKTFMSIVPTGCRLDVTLNWKSLVSVSTLVK